jgi:hypothetical protein
MKNLHHLSRSPGQPHCGSVHASRWGHRSCGGPHIIQAAGRWASNTFHIYIQKHPALLQAMLHANRRHHAPSSISHLKTFLYPFSHFGTCFRLPMTISRV